MKMEITDIQEVISAADAGFNGNLRCILKTGAGDSRWKRG